MPKAVEERPMKEWEKELSKIKKSFYKEEVLKLYAERKLKDGELFHLNGCMVKYPGAENAIEAVAFGTMLYGKMVFVRYSAKDRRLKRLVKQGMAILNKAIQTSMVNTRQVSYVPHRYQSLKNPDLTLYGADSLNSDFESPLFKKEQQIFDERSIQI